MSLKLMVFCMIDCQEQCELMTVLSHVTFILFINAFRLIIFKPPSQYCLTTALYFIFAGPSHRNSKKMSFNSFIIFSLGFGIDINK